MKWFVYILQCRDKSLYTGISLDVERRLREHREGRGSRYVRSKLPIKLVYVEKLPSKSAALKREALIKTFPRRDKIALLTGNF